MTLDDITRMAREAGYGWALADLHIAALERFANLVAAAEREACACEAEGIANSIHGYDKHGYAEAIRARSEQ